MPHVSYVDRRASSLRLVSQTPALPTPHAAVTPQASPWRARTMCKTRGRARRAVWVGAAASGLAWGVRQGAGVLSDMPGPRLQGGGLSPGTPDSRALPCTAASLLLPAVLLRSRDWNPARQRTQNPNDLTLPVTAMRVSTDSRRRALGHQTSASRQPTAACAVWGPWRIVLAVSSGLGRDSRASRRAAALLTSTPAPRQPHPFMCPDGSPTLGCAVSRNPALTSLQGVT